MGSVAITGVGLVVPGHTCAEQLFFSLSNGVSLLRRDKNLEELGVHGVTSGYIDRSDIQAIEDANPEVSGNNTSTAGKMAYHAAKSSMSMAAIDFSIYPRERSGLFLGFNKNAVTIEHLYSMWSRFDEGSSTLNPAKCDDKKTLSNLRQNQVTELISKYCGHNGHVNVHSSACTAGASAITSGFRRIRSGEYDMALCGASEEATQPLMQFGFHKIGAMANTQFNSPEEVSRPFDKDRTGCVLADGAAFLVLEDVEKAMQRRVKPLAYIAGASRQSEAYKLTSTAPDGHLYEACMQAALDDAGLLASDIDHISAHGTSTVRNDAAESRAIYKMFGARPTVTSTKSALGHSLAASGAIEVVLSVIALHQQKVLPTLNYHMPREDEPSLNIKSKVFNQEVNVVLSNSFGFGGENCSIVITKEKS